MSFTKSPIARLIVQRAGLGLLSLVLVSLVIFVSVSLLPGDFATEALGQSATPEAVDALRRQLGLDQPWPQRYFSWIGAALVGDFGNSFSGIPVATVIFARLGNTLLLAATTAVIVVPLALGLGVLCVLHHNRLTDRVISAVTLASISLPQFLIAYLLMLVFAIKLGWLPTLSRLSPNMDTVELLRRMALPVATLVFATLAHMMRNTRAAILNVMSSQYVEMAWLKGEPPLRIVAFHALPNAIGPIASVIAINLAYLITGVIVVEVVFVYPGIGQTMVDAVRNRDIPVIQACTLIFAATYIIFNLLADIAGILSNPRYLHPRQTANTK